MKLGTQEKAIQREIQTRLRILGIVLWRRNVGCQTSKYRGRRRLIRFALKGQSDLYGVGPGGRHWEIEVKRRGRLPSVSQVAWMRLCGELGAAAFWADCPDLAERVALALLEGGRIKWYDDGDYDVEFPGEDP
jgi:hypothetical protein